MKDKIIKKAIFPQFYKETKEESKLNLDIIKDVEVKLDMKIGEAVLPISEIQKFSPGYLISLKKDNSEVLVDILVDNKFIAKGEVVLINDEIYVRVLDIKK